MRSMTCRTALGLAVQEAFPVPVSGAFRMRGEEDTVAAADAGQSQLVEVADLSPYTRDTPIDTVGELAF